MTIKGCGWNFKGTILVRSINVGFATLIQTRSESKRLWAHHPRCLPDMIVTDIGKHLRRRKLGEPLGMPKKKALPESEFSAGDGIGFDAYVNLTYWKKPCSSSSQRPLLARQFQARSRVRSNSQPGVIATTIATARSALVDHVVSNRARPEKVCVKLKTVKMEMESSMAAADRHR